MARAFRTDESIKTERSAREAITAFLEERGFSDVRSEITQRGAAITQIIHALRGGRAYAMRVRLCWRRDGRNPQSELYAASQLTTRVPQNEGAWRVALERLSARDLTEGVSHWLIVQYSKGSFVLAALMPATELVPIMLAQRAVGDRLIAQGLAGRRRRNPVENGDSPTIYLQDDRTPFSHALPDVLWSWPGVTNLRAFGTESGGEDALDDFFIDPVELGRDEGERIERVVAGYRRDRLVRQAVAKRAKGACERPGCGEARSYPGFLDVHHILGVGISDRVWNCVALCPNCHREAHMSPDRMAVNSTLAIVARQASGVADQNPTIMHLTY